jgi:hypothetical protein
LIPLSAKARLVGTTHEGTSRIASEGVL